MTNSVKKERGAWYHRMMSKRADFIKMLLAIVFLLLVFVPLLRMFLQMDRDSIRNIFESPSFGSSVLHSLTSALLSTVITVILAFALAMWLERTNIRLRGLFSILFVLPMLVPSISHGMGLIILFGNNGILTQFFGWEANIYGLGGIVVGSVLYAFPVAFLMLSDVIRYEDSSPYEAATVLGLSKRRQFTAITFPYLRKPLISVVFSVFTLVITDYGVPVMVGGQYKTLAVVMYEEAVGLAHLGEGAVLGSLLLLPAVIAFVIDLFNKDRGNMTFVIKQHPRSNRLGKKVVAYVGCALVSLFVLLPIVSFVILAFSTDYPNNLTFTFDHFLRAKKLYALDYLLNSLLIAILVAVIGVCIAFMTAYLAARMKSKMSRFLHLSAMTSAAIPGMVLGLSYVLSFKSLPIYGTILILVMVNLVHFIASPYLMIYNSLSKINENLEPVAQTMRIDRLHMIRDVFIPQCKGTLIEMFSYFFVNCMITISAVSFLAKVSNRPLSLLINQLEQRGQFECIAVVSLMILTVNLIVKGIAYFIKVKHNRGKRKRTTI